MTTHYLKRLDGLPYTPRNTAPEQPKQPEQCLSTPVISRHPLPALCWSLNRSCWQWELMDSMPTAINCFQSTFHASLLWASNVRVAQWNIYACYV